MRVLFAARHFGAFRNYEPVIRGLAERGHAVHLAGDVPDVLGGQALVERLAAAYPGLSWGMAPSLEAWPWRRAGAQARNGLEAVRFSAPAYDALPKYRNRSLPKAPAVIAGLARSGAGRRLAAGLLRAVERGTPPPSALVAWIRAQQPDVVLLASVTHDGAPQMDHLKAALAAGIPVGLPVYSWDHLSGKAVLHIRPDRLLVWNRTQQEEAVRLHGFPPEIVEVTGAYGYEPWLTMQPSGSRDTFCRALGFDPARPVLAYLCSVLSRPAPDEAPFVLDWIRALRASGDPALREAGIIVRPHPERLGEWTGVGFEGLGPVALRGRNPIDPDAKREYFDTLYHASAVVGIVTSAFIEAAVVGRPGLAIEAEAFREHQAGAPHYHYLRDPEHGLLLTAPDLAGHLRQLSAVVAGDPAARARTAAFVDRFVRPPAGQASAVDAFVTAVERLAAVRPARPRVFGRGAAGLCAAAWRALDRAPGARLWLQDRQDRTIEAREAEVERARAARVAAHEAHRAQEERERAREAGEKAARVRERQAQVEARERERAATKAARQRAREERQRMLERRARAREAEKARGAWRRRWRGLLRRARLVR